MISERRNEMALGTHDLKGDFLTLLLQDELFKDDEKTMIDECVMFLFAATTTT